MTASSFSSLRACKKAFKQAIYTYQRLIKKLAPPLLDQFELSIDKLHEAIEAKNLPQARQYAQLTEQFLQEHNKKKIWGHFKEFFVAIVIALAIAGVVRQMWFELYEIPSGSMRPTFKEKDGVFALKDTFCLNVPFETRHFLFDPELVRRGSITIITGDQLDFNDVDTTYFGIFPGKRRYVKRCVAKGGDTIYFYGGKIYGIDKDGTPIEEAVPIEHVPFITFEGKYEQTIPSANRSDRTLFLRHMNIPIGKINLSASGTVTSQVPTPDGWKKETLTKGSYPEAFFEFWGIGNFAISKLISPSELPKEAADYKDPQAKLYLELIHTPTLPTKLPDSTLLNTRKTWLPLEAEQCNKLTQALYTARFFVRSGKAFLYSPEGPSPKSVGVFISKDIPDGCYEFFDGVAYEIGWGAISHQLDTNHPIYPKTAEALKLLYNSGMELYPFKRDAYPARYTYFRDGNLFTMTQPIFDKTDPLLVQFINQETTRENQTPEYIAFIDQGAPVKEGQLDIDFIKAFGLKIPEDHYLLLGDNHAMSHDSRFIGAVPQKNLQGSPTLIFWPPGNRWGNLEQPSVPFLRMPNVIILSAAAVISIICWVVYSNNRTYRRFDRCRKQRTK